MAAVREGRANTPHLRRYYIKSICPSGGHGRGHRLLALRAGQSWRVECKAWRVGRVSLPSLQRIAQTCEWNFKWGRCHENGRETNVPASRIAPEASTGHAGRCRRRHAHYAVVSTEEAAGITSRYCCISRELLATASVPWDFVPSREVRHP